MRRRLKSQPLWLACFAGLCSISPAARAVVTFGGTGNNYTPAPGGVDAYEGQLNGTFTGTAISPTFVVGATHTFGFINEPFVYSDGTTYNMQVVASLDDLEIWQIAPNQTGTFTSYAPIYTGNSEVGSTVVDVGRGFARGSAITGGWNWGGGQGPFSWGDNVVSAVDTDTQLGLSGALGGDYIQSPFNNNPADPNEFINTEYDSGGGLFIDVNGTYELAGVNTTVDTVASGPSSSDSLQASLYDTYGYYDQASGGAWFQITTHTPESSYATRVSSKQNFIQLADGAISAANAARAPITIDPNGQMVTFTNMTTGAIVGGGTLQVGSNFATATLQIAPNSGVSELSSLLLFNGNYHNSTLDITNNRIVIDYGSTWATESALLQYLKSGCNGGAWNGPGIDSSTAAASGGAYGVGFAEENDIGVPGLSSGQAEVAYALYGDCNLDGVVNGIDFGVFAANFNKGTNNGWEAGDFLYQGVVNGIDLALIADNLNHGAAGNSADLAAIDAFAAANDISLNLPEPGPVEIGLCAAVGVFSLRHRRPRAE